MPRRDNIKLISVAALCLTFGLSAPAIGHGVQHAVFAHNADKVDGRHAVGAAATVNQRKGKLLATSPTTGRLPNNIIGKAPDADRLDGKDSSVFLNRYTRQQIDAMPASRLLGYGQVSSTGSLLTSSYFPGGSASRVGVGVYVISVPGYSPGCTDPFPTLVVTPTFTPGQAASGAGSMACSTGDLAMQVSLTNSAGTAHDQGFMFMLLDGGAPSPPSARLAPRDAEVCELRQDGVHCR